MHAGSGVHHFSGSRSARHASPSPRSGASTPGSITSNDLPPSSNEPTTLQLEKLSVDKQGGSTLESGSSAKQLSPAPLPYQALLNSVSTALDDALSEPSVKLEPGRPGNRGSIISNISRIRLTCETETTQKDDSGDDAKSQVDSPSSRGRQSPQSGGSALAGAVASGLMMMTPQPGPLLAPMVGMVVGFISGRVTTSYVKYDLQAKLSAHLRKVDSKYSYFIDACFGKEKLGPCFADLFAKSLVSVVNGKVVKINTSRKHLSDNPGDVALLHRILMAYQPSTQVIHPDAFVRISGGEIMSVGLPDVIKQTLDLAENKLDSFLSVGCCYTQTKTLFQRLLSSPSSSPRGTVSPPGSR